MNSTIDEIAKGESFNQQLDDISSLVIAQYQTEKNMSSLSIWFTKIIESNGVLTDISDLLNIEEAKGLLLDLIGKILAVTRVARTTDYPDGLMDDDSYRMILKFAFIQKNTFPSIPNINTALLNLLGEGFIISEGDLSIQYIFSSPDLNQAIVNTLLDKKLLPKPVVVEISAIINPPVVGKFFSIPLDIIDGTAVYRSFEEGLGGVVYDPYYNY